LLPSSSKQRGEVVENLFAYRASAFGLTVCRPLGDSAPYDFIIDAAGLHRVQVRSVSVRSGCGSFAVTCSYGSRAKRPYPPGSIDFIAAYLLPLDTWYIIPFAELRGRTRIHIFPDDPQRDVHLPFRQAWHLVGATPSAHYGPGRP
jgi:hypothetical protein